MKQVQVLPATPPDASRFNEWAANTTGAASSYFHSLHEKFTGFPDARVLSIRYKGELVGGAYTQDRWLNVFVLHSEFERRGIGRWAAYLILRDLLGEHGIAIVHQPNVAMCKAIRHLLPESEREELNCAKEKKSITFGPDHYELLAPD